MMTNQNGYEMEPEVSRDYKMLFKEIKQFSEKNISVELQNSLELPEFTARHIRDNINSLRLYKLDIILNSVIKFKLKENEILPIIPTIYLYGPYIIGEHQATHGLSILPKPIEEWTHYQKDDSNSGNFSLNEETIKKLDQKYHENKDVSNIINKIESLPDPYSINILRLSYDFVLGREHPTGSVRLSGCEAFSEVVINTLCKNYIKSEKIRYPRPLIQDSNRRGRQKGDCMIPEIRNKSKGNDWPWIDELKIGPYNHLLTYHAVYFLNALSRRADVNTITSLLASHYLFSKEKISYYINDAWKGKMKVYYDAKQAYESGKYGGISDREGTTLKVIEKITHDFDPNGFSIDNVKKSLSFLSNKKFIEKDDGKYFALYEIVNGFPLPKKETYEITIGKIRKHEKHIN